MPDNSSTTNGRKTIQSGIKHHNIDANELTKYALFLGGLDVTHDVLDSYDPFIGGKARIFMTRVPLFVEIGIPDALKKFKHILEYGNTSINGVNDIDVDTAPLSGGYVGRDFAIPTIAKDSTNQFTIETYEFSGRPISEVLHWWISGVIDFQTGFATYHGVDCEVKQSNHTAEFIYVVTDRTGRSDSIEYACMFANCFPTNIPKSYLNYQQGQAEIATMSLNFTCTVYESPQINEIAKQLLTKYQILMDSLDFCPKTKNVIEGLNGTHYDIETGTLKPNTAQ